MSTRWILLIAATLALAPTGCENAAVVKSVENEPPPHSECLARAAGDGLVFRDCIALSPADKVNVLFVIDHDAHALGLQARLAEAMPVFVDALAQLDPVPYVRVGFTTSQDGNPACEIGPGAAGRLWRASCREHPQDFVTDSADRFDDVCAARCDLDRLDDSPGVIPTTEPWIDIAVDEQTGLDRDAAAQALACNALLGVSDCPYTAPVASTSMAWTRMRDDGEAQFGFWRDAPTLVVMVSAGHECSVSSEGVEAFDPEGERALWSDPTAAAATPAVCFAAGHVCDPPDGDGQMNCTPADIGLDGSVVEEGAILRTVPEMRASLESMGRLIQLIFPDRPLAVFMIAGTDADDPTAAPVYGAPADPAIADELGVAPICEVEGEPVLPAGRLHALALDPEVIGSRDMEVDLSSACVDDYSLALVRVVDRIDEQLRPMCIPACVADDDEDTPGLQVDCRFTGEYPNDGGGLSAFVLPPCEAGQPLPESSDGCWFPKTGEDMDPVCADEGWNLEIGVRWHGPFPGGGAIKMSCTLSQDKSADCPELN